MHRRTSRRRPMLLLVLMLVVGAALALTGFSSATYTSTSVSTGTVSAAADWTAPTVAVQAPASALKGTVTLTATAADATSGLKSVAIQYRATGDTAWTTLCTDTTTPYTCSWNTLTATDGAYELQAVATDNAANTGTSDVVAATIANSPVVTLVDPGDVVSGTVTLTAGIDNPGTATYTARIEYSPAGTNTWSAICSNLSSPYSCTVDTSFVTSGTYDLRAVAVTGTKTYTSTVLTDIHVDNVAPTVTMTDPGSPLSGTRTFAATADDAGSSVEQVVIQYAISGSTTYKVLCTVTETPYSCVTDTNNLPNGTYSFRAVATDTGGNTGTSAVVTGRVVANTATAVTVTDPGSYLSGTETLTAVASSPNGVASVRIQRATAGGTTWTDICTDTTSPYSCSWNTTTVSDGLYDLRAVMTDRTGKTTTSVVVSARRVDNSPARAVDVQTTNGGTAGRLDSGDTLVYTYSEQIAPGSLLSGWSGASTAVSVRLRDGALLSQGSTGDTVDVTRSGTTVALGAVNLKQDFITTQSTAVLNATMTSSTATVNGVVRTIVTLRLGTVASGSSALKTTTTAASMVWSPSAAATDMSGNVCSTASATETGTTDRDF